MTAGISKSYKLYNPRVTIRNTSWTSWELLGALWLQEDLLATDLGVGEVPFSAPVSPWKDWKVAGHPKGNLLPEGNLRFWKLMNTAICLHLRHVCMCMFPCIYLQLQDSKIVQKADVKVNVPCNWLQNRQAPKGVVVYIWCICWQTFISNYSPRFTMLLWLVKYDQFLPDRWLLRLFGSGAPWNTHD